MFAGLRRGELMGLRWEDVDLADNVIHVRRAWDIQDGPIEPKTRAGTRDVPIAGVLHDYLDEHKLSTRRDHGLVFGRTAELPFVPWSVDKRARDAWETAGLDGLTLHEGRHTFASLLIEAGVSAKKVSTYMGHAGVSITLDRYAKLFDRHERDTLDKLDSFLERADTAARLAQVEGGGER